MEGGLSRIRLDVQVGGQTAGFVDDIFECSSWTSEMEGSGSRWKVDVQADFSWS